MTQLFLCQNFPSTGYSHLLPRMIANIDKREFTKSLITVGYPSRRKARTTVGIWRARMLKNMVTGYLDDNLSLTNYFVNLEGSEKATVSFLFAQALTHWFAQNHMNMYYLVHVLGAGESYQNSGAGIALKPGSSAPKEKGRPDFIGRCAHGFHVFETKGRSDKGYSSSISPIAPAQALAQVSKINLINNQSPITRVAACYKFHRGGFLGDMRDPPASEISYDLIFNENRAIAKYYNFFLDTELIRLKVGDNHLMAIEIEDGFYYGLEESIYNEVKEISHSHRQTENPTLLSRLKEIPRSPKEDALIGPDGISFIGREMIRAR